MIDLAQFAENITPRLYEDMQEVARAAAQSVLQSANEAITERGAFHLVLAGGTTPRLAYRRLVEAETDWRRWHIYFGDERCLPIDDRERNSVMAQGAWLKHVAIPPSQIHPIAAELGAAEGARAYSQVIEKVLPFDLVLLGMGEDGHTASLFPGHLDDVQERVHAVHQAPKPPSDRISLSRYSLCATRKLLLLVTGSAKQAALAKWVSGELLPVASLTPECGVELFLDKEAAGIVN